MINLYMLKEFSGMIHTSIKVLKSWDNPSVLIAYQNQKTNKKRSPQEKLVQDLLSIIHVCSRNIYD